MSLFQPPGSSILLVVQDGAGAAKEVQVLLHNTDVQAFYTWMKNFDLKVLFVALERADRNLNVGGPNSTIRIR